MDKALVLSTFFFCVSCSALMNGQSQPVKLIDNSRSNTYTTTCNGTAETMGSCYQKAKETCNKGYKTLNEKIDSTGIFREIVFQCQ